MIDIQFISKRKKGIIDVIVNGEIEHDVPYTKEDRARKESILFSNQKIINNLVLRTFNEVGIFIQGFSYKKWMGNLEIEFTIYVVCKELSESRSSYLIICPLLDLGSWKKLYSVRELIDSVQVEYERQKIKKLQYHRYDDDDTECTFDFWYETSVDARIAEKLDKVLDLIDKILVKAIDNLIRKIDYGSVVTFFYFPEAVRSVYQQYLLYFSQFLLDLDIEVEAQVKEEEEKTILKVTPTNKSEALEGIWHALQIYLTAPNNINVDSPDFVDSDIAISQWRINIVHLKDQLILAQSAIQMKDAAIESLKLLNYQYRQIVNEELVNKSSPKEEDLIKGVLSVTKFEGKGFVINLAEILRKLKRRYKKK
jgi:hypothetical protein